VCPRATLKATGQPPASCFLPALRGIGEHAKLNRPGERAPADRAAVGAAVSHAPRLLYPTLGEGTVGRYEEADGKGYIDGKLTAEDVDSNAGEDPPTVRTPSLRKAIRKMYQTPKGKGQR
jgi:hypothetical protein